MNKGRRVVFTVLIAMALMIVAAYYVLGSSPSAEFKFLEGDSLIHNMDVIIERPAKTDVLSTAVTYESKKSLADTINLASKELYAKGWSRADLVLKSSNEVYS